MRRTRFSAMDTTVAAVIKNMPKRQSKLKKRKRTSTNGRSFLVFIPENFILLICFWVKSFPKSFWRTRLTQYIFCFRFSRKLFYSFNSLLFCLCWPQSIVYVGLKMLLFSKEQCENPNSNKKNVFFLSELQQRNEKQAQDGAELFPSFSYSSVLA